MLFLSPLSPKFYAKGEEWNRRRCRKGGGSWPADGICNLCWRQWGSLKILRGGYDNCKFICGKSTYLWSDIIEAAMEHSSDRAEYVFNVTLWLHTLGIFLVIVVTFFLLPYLLGQTYLPMLLEIKINDSFLQVYNRYYSEHTLDNIAQRGRSWGTEHSRWHQKREGLSWFCAGVNALSSLLPGLKGSRKQWKCFKYDYNTLICIFPRYKSYLLSEKCLTEQGVHILFSVNSKKQFKCIVLIIQIGPCIYLVRSNNRVLIGPYMFFTCL